MQAATEIQFTKSQRGGSPSADRPWVTDPTCRCAPRSGLLAGRLLLTRSGEMHTGPGGQPHTERNTLAIWEAVKARALCPVWEETPGLSACLISAPPPPQ